MLQSLQYLLLLILLENRNWNGVYRVLARQSAHQVHLIVAVLLHIVSVLSTVGGTRLPSLAENQSMPGRLRRPKNFTESLPLASEAIRCPPIWVMSTSGNV